MVVSDAHGRIYFKLKIIFFKLWKQKTNKQKNHLLFSSWIKVTLFSRSEWLHQRCNNSVCNPNPANSVHWLLHWAQDKLSLQTHAQDKDQSFLLQCLVEIKSPDKEVFTMPFCNESWAGDVSLQPPEPCLAMCSPREESLSPASTIPWQVRWKKSIGDLLVLKCWGDRSPWCMIWCADFYQRDSLSGSSTPHPSFSAIIFLRSVLGVVLHFHTDLSTEICVCFQTAKGDRKDECSFLLLFCIHSWDATLDCRFCADVKIQE